MEVLAMYINEGEKRRRVNPMMLVYALSMRRKAEIAEERTAKTTSTTMLGGHSRG